MVTGFRLNLSPLKEPLGFIKLVEWLTAIFAFGSCGGYSGKNIISLACGDGTNETLDANFHYPFRLSQVPLIEGNATVCNRSVTATHLVGDSASSVEFFVGIAVVCFLYSLVALLVYLGYMHVYKDSDFGPIFVSIDLVGFFLVSLPITPPAPPRLRSSSPGLCDHGGPGFPVARVFVGLGEGPAEREGRHGHLRHRQHAGPVQGGQRHLRGDAVRQHEDPQHLRGVWLPQHASVGDQRLVRLQGNPLALPEDLLSACRGWKATVSSSHVTHATESTCTSACADDITHTHTEEKKALSGGNEEGD